MATMCKLIIFDLDGTLLNTLEDLCDCVNYALCKSGMPQHTLEDVRMMVGNGIGKLIERAVPSTASESAIREVFDSFCSYYFEHCTDKTAPYDGIREMLITLKDAGCVTAVVSNKADFAVKALCEKFFVGILDYAVGERENVRRKPSPDSVFEVIRLSNSRVEDAVYIGDSDVDIQTARNAGIECISVDWGFRSRDFLLRANASRVVSSPQELISQLL